MKEQYTSSYSSPPSQVQNIVKNNVSLLEEYILYQTGENEYTATIYNKLTGGKAEEIRIYKQGQTGYTNIWDVERKEVDIGKWKVNNEYYCISNIGIGSPIDMTSRNTEYISFGILLALSATIFILIFRRVFPWSKK